MATNLLKSYFPMIQSREEILQRIYTNPRMQQLFESWTVLQQKEFLDFCSGARGIKVLYDSFFKEVMNPEYDPTRLESFLTALLNRKVRIKEVLPNDSTRLSDESSLLITDIIVELEDGSLANIEVQKIGYAFPGARCACYSSDMLLRQYKRVRQRSVDPVTGRDTFSYRNISKVYLIVLYEKSPDELKKCPDHWIHRSKVSFDSGLSMDLLQDYIFISLDIFRSKMHNKKVTTLLEAWMIFLSIDDPDEIIRLITSFPQFKPMYETLYQMCRNVENIMGFFSEELREMDRNTVRYMIDELQKEVDVQNATIAENAAVIAENNAVIAEMNAAIAEKESLLAERDSALAEKESLIAEKDSALAEKDSLLSKSAATIAALQAELSRLKNL
ncbi:PD-(D/E)XK nuclease family transposase [Suilimivivens sp.]|uniref:PD-(D/E)XK nuclease family transposase n=2 Tax=Suilimivivens sp. TaxID=2981669 RepID=UPI0030791C1E